MPIFGSRTSIGRTELISLPGRRLVTAMARGRPASKAKEPSGSDDAAEADVVPRRLSKLMQRYQNSDLETQQLEAFEYRAERAAAAAKAPRTRDGRPAHRQNRAAKYVAATDEANAKREQMFAFDPNTGKEEPVIGVYGGGEPQWWALRINPGREKQVADAIARLLPFMAPVDFTNQSREAEYWIPAKKVRAWSPKTGRMGAKSLKYEDGGWLLLRTVMDKTFATMLSGNINVLGYRDREVYEGVEFPRPATPELLQTVAEWEADLSDITEEQVKHQLGLIGERLSATSDVTEEFFFEEDFQALQEREAARGARGGRGGARGRGGREGSYRGISGFYSADEGRGRGRGERRDYYGEDSWDSRRGGRGDRQERRQGGRGRREERDAGGWYDGSSAGMGEDSGSGWYSGALSPSFSSSDNDNDFTEGWFSAEAAPRAIRRGERRQQDRSSQGNVGGGLLSDDDFEIWSEAIGEDITAGPVNEDDLDAVWGQSGSGGAGNGFGGWLSANDTGSAGGFDERSERFDRGGRAGRGRERSERGGRGEGRDRERGRGRRSYDDDNNNTGFSDSSSGGRYEFGTGAASMADDLSWWDDLDSSNSGASAGSGSDSFNDVMEDTARAVQDSKSSGRVKGIKAADSGPSGAANDSIDWFNGDDDGWGDAVREVSDEPALSAGTTIEVVRGKFADFEGVVIGSGKDGRVKAKLDIFGTPTEVEIPRHEIEKLDD